VQKKDLQRSFLHIPLLRVKFEENPSRELRIVLGFVDPT
jgi:hypothetical protein